jgi:hypothetical protein
MVMSDIYRAAQSRALAHEIWALEGGIGDLREAIAAGGAKMKEDIVPIDGQAKDGEQQSQVMSDVQNAVGRLHTVVEDKGCCALAASERAARSRGGWVEAMGGSTGAG